MRTSPPDISEKPRNPSRIVSDAILHLYTGLQNRSPDVLQTKIALIDQTGKVSSATLSAVAAALQIQVNRDLARFWPVSTTVTTLPDPKHGSVPLSTRPIYIVPNLPPGEGGYHWMTGRNQPYSVVEYGPGWTVAASHECLEMSVDLS